MKTQTRYMKDVIGMRDRLLKGRPKAERVVAQFLEDMKERLSSEYRITITPQRILSILPTKRYPTRRFLAFADFYIRSVSRRTNHGRKFWLEVDGGYHTTKTQEQKDSEREVKIKKFIHGHVEIIRIPNEWINEDFVKEFLTKRLEHCLEAK